MDIHNTAEELVIAEVAAICDTLEAGNKENICTCKQCRQDVACYVLNRITPHYVVSHRGMARANLEKDHQSRADLTALVYEGFKRISHNQRPYADHKHLDDAFQPDAIVFNIPTIIGQVYNGLNFSPVMGISVELLQSGKLAEMKDHNWQNPYPLIASTSGTFTFLPKPVPAEGTAVHKVFEFTIKIADPGFSELNHAFSIPVVSELAGLSISLSRTYKLPDLYLFPPGEEKNQRLIIQ